MVEGGAAEDRCSNGAYCPRVSVVLGDVIDIGESAWRFTAAVPVSRLRVVHRGLPGHFPEKLGHRVIFRLACRGR